MSNKENLYGRWISGDLSPEEIQALKASGEWEELQSIIDVADNFTLPTYNKAKGFEQLKRSRNASQAKTAEPKTEAKVRSINYTRILGIAASILFLIGAFIFLRSSETMIATPNGETKAHVLADRSTVLLNAGSSIEYEKFRTIKLTGEAVFDVEKGAPFSVITKNGTVEVLGTSFNVRAWGDNLYVECYSGKVKVNSGGNETILTKGQAVNVVNGRMQERQEFGHTQALWTSDVSMFHAEDLNSVLQELERQYNIKVTAPVFSRSFSGSFGHQSILNAVEQICKPMGLTYKISDDKKSVTITE